MEEEVAALPRDLVLWLREDGTPEQWDDQRQAASTEIERLRQHIEWVMDHSNDPQIVRFSRSILGLPIIGGHEAT